MLAAAAVPPRNDDGNVQNGPTTPIMPITAAVIAISPITCDCAIAAEATFIMNGGNHVTDALSTYPFAIFGEGWESAAPAAWPNRGDTVVGNDVWIGYRATIMPGIRIGDGAIIGSCSVVTRDVPPYAVVGGNPAGVIRMRFDAPVIERLLAAAWWDWPADKVTRNLAALTGNDPGALDRLR